jgi:hypothetical protein
MSGSMTRGALVFMVAGAALIGCQTTVEQYSNARPLPPMPNAAPPVPAGAKANSMAFLLLGARPRDSDGNGRPDLILVEAYLFSEPFPTPLYESGTFIFDLYAPGQSSIPDAKPARTWRFDPQQVLASHGRSLAGVSHRFSLSLLENGGDAMPFRAADLTATFEPADGGPAVRAIGVRTVQLAPDGG